MALRAQPWLVTGSVVVPVYIFMWGSLLLFSQDVKHVVGLIKVSVVEGHGYRTLQYQGKCCHLPASDRGQDLAHWCQGWVESLPVRSVSVSQGTESRVALMG